MYYRILVNTEGREWVEKFVDRLRKELMAIGERESGEGRKRRPVSEADHFEGIRTYYISGHQHRSSSEDFRELVSLCYKESFGHLRNYQLKMIPDNYKPGT